MTTDTLVVSRIVRNGKVVTPPRTRRRVTSEYGRELASRVRFARLAHDKRITEVCEALEIDKGLLSNLERHFTEASEKKFLDKIAAYYAVSLDWLRTGAGESGLPVCKDLSGPETTLGFEKRAELAARAKARRQLLRLSFGDIRDLKGPSASQMELWEQCLPLYRDWREDGWEDALQVNRGWLRDETMQADAPVFRAPTDQ